MIRFRPTKSILLFALSVYILVLTFDIINNAGLKRFITIESTNQHGIIMINNVKYPTLYRLERAKIKYTVTGPIEYLLLPSGTTQNNILSALLQLSIFILCAVFVWSFDFDDPFTEKYLTRVYLIYKLFFISFLLKFLTGAYLSSWHGDFLYRSGYHLYGDPGIAPQYWLLIAVLTVAIYLYSAAVKNRQELELTI